MSSYECKNTLTDYIFNVSQPVFVPTLRCILFSHFTLKCFSQWVKPLPQLPAEGNRDIHLAVHTYKNMYML